MNRMVLRLLLGLWSGKAVELGVELWSGSQGNGKSEARGGAKWGQEVEPVISPYGDSNMGAEAKLYWGR